MPSEGNKPYGEDDTQDKADRTATVQDLPGPVEISGTRTHARPSSSVIPPAVSRVLKATAATVAIAAFIAVETKPKSPRPPRVRTDEIDGTERKTAGAPGSACDFQDADGSGEEIVSTLEVYDDQGNPLPCFFTRPWAPSAAVKLFQGAAVIGNMAHPGKIKVQEGEVEMTLLDQNNQTEATVQGEAALSITTTKKVALTLRPHVLDAGGDASIGSGEREVFVYAADGETTIVQAGRADPIILQKGEGMTIPLNIEIINNGGCVIADTGVEHKGVSDDGPMYMLLAGAVFLAFRRKTRNNASV